MIPQPSARPMLAASFALILAVLLAALPAGAQTTEKVPHIGYLWLGAEGSESSSRLGLQQGLRELGYHEGRDIVVEYRYADGDVERLRGLVSDLVASNVDLILAPGTVVTDAVKRATTTIPVVATTGDPVGSGFVASLARPGGNITGWAINVGPEIGGKWLGLLHDLAPRALLVAALWNPSSAVSQNDLRAMREAAGSLGLTVLPNGVRRPADFAVAFDAITGKNPDGLVTDADPLLVSFRKGIVEFAAAHRLPAVYGLRDFDDDGGLMSYGASIFDLWRRRVAGYVDKILKGAKPADLPVEQPTKFELVVNLKTAKALGLTIPPLILARADEVIE
jgi:putative tryptophan/tyrosine transport system substrate-binding protein